MQPNSKPNAGLLRRTVAFLLDKILGLILVLAILLVYSYFGTSNDGMEFLKIAGNIISVVIIFILLGTLINLLYNVFFLSKFGGTLGKLLLGIQVFDKETNKFLTPKKAFFRTFAGYTFSNQFLGLGYLAINKKRNNVAWHDELFNTEVKVTGSIWPGLVLALLFVAVNIFVVLPFILSLALKAVATFGPAL